MYMTELEKKLITKRKKKVKMQKNQNTINYYYNLKC